MVYWGPSQEEQRSAEPVSPDVRRSVFVDDAAELLGVSRRTIYNRIRDGRLQTIRTKCGTTRVLLQSVERLLREEMAARRRRL